MADIPEQVQTLSKLYEFAGLKVDKDKHMKYEQGKTATLPTLYPSALVGIEIEVENIDSIVNTDYYWQGKEDGSLRNHGAEFASIPLRVKQAEFALDFLNKSLTEFNKPEFSNRTSVHIHLNVRDMTWEQIKILVIIYAMYERHFFHQVGTRRESSIFCVPLYKTHQLKHFMQNEVGSVKAWHKYNAINLGTILGSDSCQKFGTIEFRHLFGTMDTKFIVNWINQILCLRQEVMNTTLPKLLEKLRRINTTSEYFADYKRIFGQYALPYSIMDKADFESCITATKRAIFAQELGKYHNCLRGSALRNYYDNIKTTKKVVQPQAAGFAGLTLNPFQDLTPAEMQVYKAKLEQVKIKMNQEVEWFVAPPAEPINNPKPVDF